MKKHQVAVKMSKPAFIKEHKHLLKVLWHGTRSGREAEAKDQAKELTQKT